jgi:predicted nucleic acid-binding Zn ribbon protein
MERKCKNCGEIFDSKYEKKFCSNRCFKQYEKRRLRGMGLTMK